MRKFWYALAGGIFLFAASPAQADALPGADAATQQADEQLADVLGQSNGLNIGNPLGHSSLKDTALGKIPIAQFQAGQNSPDLDPVLPGQNTDSPRRGLMPRESGSDERPGSSVGSAGFDGSAGSDASDGSAVSDGSGRSELPAADVVPDSTLPFHGLPLYGTDVSGLPWMTSLLPSGQTRDFTSPPPARQAEMFTGGVPLLGGLGGTLPANSSPRTLPAGDEPDISGMPGGGVALLPAALGSPAAAAGSLVGVNGSPVPAGSTPPAGAAPNGSTPAASAPAGATGATGAAGAPGAGAPHAGAPGVAGAGAPAAAGAGASAAAGSPAAGHRNRPATPGKPAKAQKHKPAPAAVPDDPRLHEEPVETDDTPEHRPFSADGRPVAGIDHQYR